MSKRYIITAIGAELIKDENGVATYALGKAAINAKTLQQAYKDFAFFYKGQYSKILEYMTKEVPMPERYYYKEGMDDPMEDDIADYPLQLDFDWNDWDLECGGRKRIRVWE